MSYSGSCSDTTWRSRRQRQQTAAARDQATLMRRFDLADLSMEHLSKQIQLTLAAQSLIMEELNLHTPPQQASQLHKNCEFFDLVGGDFRIESDADACCPRDDKNSEENEQIAPEPTRTDNCTQCEMIETDIISRDMATQWDPCVLPDYEQMLQTVQDILDEYVGYANLPLSRYELKERAVHLLMQGETEDSLRHKCAAHDTAIDQVRPGDSLARVCGTSWFMSGHNGRGYTTQANIIKIRRIAEGGTKAYGECPQNHTHGEVDLVTVIFENIN